MLEKLIAPLAPFYCVSCSKIGYILCPDCEATELETVPSRCYRCHKATVQHQVCSSCRRISPLEHVWVASNYTGRAKEIIELLKFERAGSASKDVARVLSNLVPLLPKDTVVCYVPTASKRIRVRGYDQSELIAKAFARERGYDYKRLVRRTSSSRQVGSGRDVRFRQADLAFGLNPGVNIKNRHILIIDDVTTSGATIEAVAKLLKKAGAKNIDATVFAQAVE